jgi:hypothetical protein
MRLFVICSLLLIGLVALVIYLTPGGSDVGETQGVPFKPGSFGADVPLEAQVPAALPVSWDFTLAVTDDSGAPVEGASAVDWLTETAHGVTLTDGEVKVSSDRDLLVLAVSAGGFASEILVIERHQSAEIARCTLIRLAAIEIVVDCEFAEESQEEIAIALVPTENSGVLSVEQAGTHFRLFMDVEQDDASVDVALLERVHQAIQQFQQVRFIVSTPPDAVLAVDEDGVARFENLPFDLAYRFRVLSAAPFDYDPAHEVVAAALNPAGSGLIVDMSIHDIPVKDLSGAIYVGSGDVAVGRAVCQRTATVSGAIVFPSVYDGDTDVILKSHERVDLNGDGVPDFGQILVEASAFGDEDGVFEFSDILAPGDKIIRANSTRKRPDGVEEIWILWRRFRCFEGENRLGELYPLNVPPIHLIIEYVDEKGDSLSGQQFDPPLPDRLEADLNVDIDGSLDKKDPQQAVFEVGVGVETVLYGLPVDRPRLRVGVMRGTHPQWGNRRIVEPARFDLSPDGNRILIPVQRIEHGTIPVNVAGGLLTLHTRPIVDSPTIPGVEHKSRSLTIPEGPHRPVDIPMILARGDFSLLVTSAEAGEYAWIPSTNLGELGRSPPIQLRPGNILEVIVSTSSGSPISGHVIRVGIEGWGNPIWWGRTDVRGVITFEGVLPEVELWLGKEKKLFSGEPGAYIRTEVTVQ